MLQFSLNSYHNLLKKALKAGYVFKDFNNDINAYNKNNAICLLRHDIDVDLEAAYKMALVENELGIKATYFVMFQSPVYNLLSRWNLSFVYKILDLGHSIGLHYDHGFDLKNQFTESQTRRNIALQANYLKNLFGQEINAVSFHQPNRIILEQQLKLDRYINTYDKSIFKFFEYYSDSNRIWQMSADESQFLNSLANKFPTNIQLLIHPIWWVYCASSTNIAWNLALVNNLENMQEQILETERAFGSRRDFLIRIRNDNNSQ